MAERRDDAALHQMSHLRFPTADRQVGDGPGRLLLRLELALKAAVHSQSSAVPVILTSTSPPPNSSCAIGYGKSKIQNECIGEYHSIESSASLCSVTMVVKVLALQGLTMMRTRDKCWTTKGTRPASITDCTCCWLPAVTFDRNQSAS